MFKNLFNSRFGQIMSRLGDLVLLQVLFLITSLPVVTIGAGLAALYAVSKKLQADSVSFVTRSYFTAFKENFKNATIVWLGLLAAGALLFFDLRFCRGSGAPWIGYLQIAFYMLGIALFLLFLYVFPSMAWFENTIDRYLGNSFRLALSHPGTTLLLAAVSAMFLVLAEYARPLAFLIGISGSVYLKTVLLCRLFFPKQSAEKNESDTE